MFPPVSQILPPMMLQPLQPFGGIPGTGVVRPFRNPWGQLGQVMMQGMAPLVQQAVPQQFIPQSMQQAMNLSQTTGGWSSNNVPEQYRPLFVEASRKYNVPQDLLEALAWQESRYNPKARSSVGAGGIMQLMPGTAKELGVTNVFDPAQNIDAGARYFSQQLRRFNNDPRLALAAYNAGPGRVIQYGNAVPPFKETQNYVQTIMGRLGR